MEKYEELVIRPACRQDSRIVSVGSPSTIDKRVFFFKIVLANFSYLSLAAKEFSPSHFIIRIRIRTVAFYVFTRCFHVGYQVIFPPSFIIHYCDIWFCKGIKRVTETRHCFCPGHKVVLIGGWVWRTECGLDIIPPGGAMAVFNRSAA